MNQQVQFISTEQAIDLRSRILRPNQPIKNCHYAGDNATSTFHLGVVTQSSIDSANNIKILSNGTFMQESLAEFAEAKLPYRLRGMATDHGCQRQGLGRLIIETALVELKKRNCDLLWFNARVSAEGFYKKFDFEVKGDVFDIPQTGPHKIMFKWL